MLTFEYSEVDREVTETITFVVGISPCGGLVALVLHYTRNLGLWGEEMVLQRYSVVSRMHEVGFTQLSSVGAYDSRIVDCTRTMLSCVSVLQVIQYGRIVNTWSERPVSRLAVTGFLPGFFDRNSVYFVAQNRINHYRTDKEIVFLEALRRGMLSVYSLTAGVRTYDSFVRLHENDIADGMDTENLSIFLVYALAMYHEEAYIVLGIPYMALPGYDGYLEAVDGDDNADALWCAPAA